MTTAKITSKGQITIPKEVRDRLGLVAGDELEFVEEDGCYQILRHVEPSVFQRYRGFLKNQAGMTSDEIVRDLRGHGS